MITQIVIRQPGYAGFTLAELTKNNIILFSSPELKDRVVAEIEKIWLLPDDDDESVSYSTANPEEEVSLDAEKQNIRYLLTTIVGLSDGQRFVFTAEPAFLYTAKDWYDIWFVTEVDGEITCHAFCEFIKSKEIWEKGPDAVYLSFIRGMFGRPYIPFRHSKTPEI